MCPVHLLGPIQFVNLWYYCYSILLKYAKMSLCLKAFQATETIWAATWENLSSVVCEQQRSWRACAYAQSDQCLCYSLSGEQSSQACFMQNSTFLASLCSWGDWFESHFVGNHEDRFCRDEAHINPDHLIKSLGLSRTVLANMVRCGTWLYRFLIFAPLLTMVTVLWCHLRLQMAFYLFMLLVSAI